MEMRLWDHRVEEALSKLESLKLIKSLKPIHLPSDERRRFVEMEQEFGLISYEFEVFDGLQEQWERASVEVEMAEGTFQRWVPSSGDDVACGNLEVGNEAGACSHQKFRKLLLFSGNDYLGLSTNPMISKAAAKAALAHGMGPKGSALICGYTNYHRLLESCLADLKSKEKPTGEFKMKRLRCPMKKKVVVTDSFFSMDGDFAPMGDLSKLQKRHGFLLVIDDFDYNLPAAVIVAQKETWRRRAIWKRVQDFHALTGIPVTSPIISLVVGSEEKALQASCYLLKSGFHFTAIRPPAVPPNSIRLRVTLSAAHTLDDLKKLTAALSECISFRDIIAHSTNGHTRL
ncbi:hypothetical protein RHGRI_008310 [Rhododendron griersonianum]|uniref:Aminotransferase class I/classII large domain-containing protein n=1 Tax=Rhododendron griersonianum TaxID=479676 RepID=A0AAV6KZX3_9ERIC|nr:hypothetical protein RHGRI_008310 [Rhododendron griersonianum]